MMKRPFIGFATPRLEYEILEGELPEARDVAPENFVALQLEKPAGERVPLPQVGDSVLTGQKLALYADRDEYLVSTVTGTLSGITNYTGDYGRNYVNVKIKIGCEPSYDEAFAEESADPGPDPAYSFLKNVPGKPPLELLKDRTRPINRVLVNCMDKDLCITSNQFALHSDVEAFKKGLDVIGNVARTRKVTVAAPEAMSGILAGISAELSVVASQYPAASDALLVKSVYGEVIPAGKKPSDLGIMIVSAEAVISLARAFETGKIPTEKIVTIIDKSGAPATVRTPVGTPVGDILKALGITLGDEDQLILGGPMTGSALYTPEFPVQPDTDAVMVVDKKQVAFSSDSACINCGDCIRVCPANIPINVMVRFLEVGHYDEAADDYDLFSCVECGQCSFVCPVKIPVFQYIKLAKYELGRISAEA